MKTCFTFITILFTAFSFGQTGRHTFQFHDLDSISPVKTTVKDYGTYQLLGGTIVQGLDYWFWIAKMQGETVIWNKTIPSNEIWTPIDIIPTDIAQCGNNGDIIFIGKGLSQTEGYITKVIKVNAAGNLLWSKKIVAGPGTFTQGIYENNPMIVEDDGVIISMAGQDNLQITKLDLSGNLVYSKQLKVQGSGADNPGHLFIPNSAGGYFAGFQCDNSVTVVSLDESLNVTWSYKIISDQISKIHSLYQTPEGEILIGGSGGLGGAGEAFIGKLGGASGQILEYRKFTNSELYSLDQLFKLNDSTILAADRLGYILLNANNFWSYREIRYESSPFSAFDKTATGWSFGSHWNYDYYLDFDPISPQCFGYTDTLNVQTEDVIATQETVTCTVSNMGTLNSYSPQLMDNAATILNDCFLAVSEEMTNDLIIYPNPVSAGAALSFSSNSGKINGDRIVFTDLQGKVLAERVFEHEITTPELSPGVYFVSITNQNGIAVSKQKIIVE